MSETRVKIQTVVQNQLPGFVAEESPLLVEFLKQYYVSQEYTSGTYDIIQNIDKYVKLDEILNHASTATLLSDIDSITDTITVFEGTLTDGFPDKYGIIKIDDEIITYTSKTDTTFEGCVRGFSGVTSYRKANAPEELVFTSTEASSHSANATITNLSSLFLQEFLTKVKKQFLPGFSDRSLASGLNQNVFIKQSKDFYTSKGTDRSFKILFNALYGENVDVIKPKEYLFRPSDAGYRKTRDIVVEAISGNPLDLLNNTLYQDEYPDYGIKVSYASITDVEKIQVGEKVFYKLGFDSDYDKDINLEGSVYGNFVVHPKTRVVTEASSGSTTIDVDSTVGFPNSGTLVCKNSSGDDLTLTYNGKSVTQFYNVEGVSSSISTAEEIRLDVFAYGYSGNSTDIISVRIGNVLGNVEVIQDTYFFSKDDTAKVKSLGISQKNPKTDNWIDNISNTFTTKNVSSVDNQSLVYNIEVYANHNFRIGDKLKATNDSSVSIDCDIIDVRNEKEFVVQSQSQLDINSILELNRYILKPNFSKYSGLNSNSTDVQNTYTNYSNEILVASDSLPSYKNQLLNPYDKKITLSGNYNGEVFTVTSVNDHGFYTGDQIYYSPFTETVAQNAGEGEEILVDVTSKFDELDEGLYYVARVNSTSFKLAKSPSNIVSNKFVSVSGIVTSNTFSYYDFQGKDIQAQNIFREIKEPVNKSGNYTTTPGKVGVLVNGVEILNYKSSEFVSYGQINSIDVTGPGTGYDVINPPSLHIEDSLGVGATGICAVEGSLDRIDILDSGFDYVNTPVVTITGGNGKNAEAEVNMISVEHAPVFTSDNASTLNIFTDVIGFTTYHKFRDNEEVFYLTDGQTGIAGLTTGAKYNVSVIDAFNVKLYKKESDSVAGINTVNLNDYGVGNHRLKSANKKKIISKIIVKNIGEGYSNKERTSPISGINTATDTINIDSHGYSTGEEIKYSTTGSVVEGLSVSKTYIVKKIDDNSFKVAECGIGTVAKTYYLDTDQYIDLRSVGSGVHSFNYTPISVDIVGNIGVSTLTGQDFSAKTQPVFKGGIESIHLTSNGSQYGSDEVINYDRQPIFELRSGKNAELLAIVDVQGTIQEVLVLNGGSGYNSPPSLNIKGTGKYARLVPVIENGEISKIITENGGVGYGNGTTVEVVPSGQGCKLFANIQKWTVNLFQKYFNIIGSDDGIVTLSDRSEYGLQYCHLYAPRSLRESIYAKDQDGLTLYGIADLRKSNNEEVPSSNHSPIIGWAYDGNPIYGPYGFAEPSGGVVRSMESGYKLVSKQNRPSFANFPQGFFIEDYEFTKSGDLDKNNGRFCVTPEYPNGVYAYFSTISSSSIDTDGPFRGYKRPVFPYFIGDTFRSEPNSFNFNKESNQKDYKINDHNWLRNTTRYQLRGNNVNSSYDYIYNPNDFKEQTINVDGILTGGVESVGILTGGDGYNPFNIIRFDNTNTGGSNASARVSRVFGKPVNTISAATTSFTEVEFSVDSVGRVIGFTTSPHGFKNIDIINVSGLNTSFSKIEGSYTIGVRTDSFVTTLGISSVSVTGLTTYFYVSGALEFPYIKENDVLGIGTQEKVKVLNVDKKSGRIRVLRQYNSTVGSSYSASTVLFEDPRKFTINTGFRTDYSYDVNTELYFKPSESVGLATVASVGSGTTVSFSLPGIGATQVFVPYQAIYFPNHGLKTGDRVTYSTHGGSEINVTNGSIYFDLPQTQDLYVAEITKDLIGISTVRLGLGTDGSFVGVGTTNSTGLLFFNTVGTGDNHSFTTKNNSIVGTVSKNIVTVSTASTHGLSSGDNIRISNIPTDQTEIVVKYSDSNRRYTFGQKSFNAADIDVSENTIYIENHNLSKGDKVIYVASTSASDLISEEMYYVDVYSKDKVKLCRTIYDLYLSEPNYVNLTSTSDGELLPVNPNLKLYRNKSVKFDLSDSSLSSSNSGIIYSAFELNFYKDSNYQFKFDGTGTTRNFETVKTSGKVGIDTSASVTLQLNDSFDDILYYRLETINDQYISSDKKEIIIDTEVNSNNQITLVDSEYSGEYRITGVGTTTFTFDLNSFPEKDLYNKTNSNIFYDTKSVRAFGPISAIEVISEGNKYESVPSIGSIDSTHGSGAILEATSKTIGRIVKKTVEDVGFDYPSDTTLSPAFNLPELIKVESLTSFASIGISSAGKDYLVPPDLIVLDGYTNNIVNDVDIEYKIGDNEVNIKRNTFGMYNVTPRIVPINNSNGVGINSITFDNTTKDVTLGIATGFSDGFPFNVGDKILIENTSVGLNTTGRGYNSSAYGYDLFTVTAVNPLLGGYSATVTFNVKEYFTGSESPGVFDPSRSFGRVIREADFPIFDIEIKTNDFIIGEEVFSETTSGTVEKWDRRTEYIKISTNTDFSIGEIIRGQTSNTSAIVSSKIDFDSYAELSPSVRVNKGWTYDTGMLNNNIQRIPDNDYYQQFSYSLKSRIPYGTWNEPVQALNHTTGFLKFSDLIIETKEDGEGSAIVNPEDSIFELVVDIVGSGNLNCTYTFDLASENNLNLSGMYSNEITLNSRVLVDYFESVGNRVLNIDNFSYLFNNIPRATRYSIVDDFDISSARVRKYFTFVRDKRFTMQRQVMAVSLLHDDQNAYLNQYGRVESVVDLGSFDFSINDSLGQLRFYPIKYTVNDYDVTVMSFDLLSNVSYGSSNPITLGNIVNIESENTVISSGSVAATTVVGIASTYRSSKVLVEIGGTDGSYHEFDEINLIHDGTNVDIVEYGQLTDNSVYSTFGIAGLGTYIPYIDGDQVKIDFKLNSSLSVDLSINSLAVSVAIASTSSVGVGTDELSTARLSSGYVAISSSPTPSETVVKEYPNNHSSAYYIISVEDTTNNRYEMSEVVLVDNGSEAYVTEFGTLSTNGSIGQVGAAMTTNGTQLTYTPNADIDVEIRVFEGALGLVKGTVPQDEIDINNAKIRTGNGSYEGTSKDVRKSFELTHNQDPIFFRYFEGNSAVGVNTNNDSIFIPNHFFVTGEEVTYSSSSSDTTQAIGIGSTTIPGIGVTDKLPSTVFVYKVNESNIRLAATAADALRQVPNTFNLTHVGIGTSHSFTAKNQNSKVMLTIDNYIQSPIVATSITSSLSKNVSNADNRLELTGITSFFSGNLIKINEEIMKISVIGFGTTNAILVERPWMGTGVSTHSSGDTVTIVQGNYNIIDNTVHFVEPPYGKNPISSDSNPPSERDWIGVTTSSKFQGRTFLRSGVINSSNEAYANNYIFDDISSEFNGVQKDFKLTSEKQNVSGFSTYHGIVLINGIFQGPPPQDGRLGDYSFSENVGISTISFTGTATSVGYDVNNANVPVGGVIVSVGSTQGFGFQPLVAAGGTATVSPTGRIISVSIGNSGSGYRSGIQTVNVGVMTESTGTPNIDLIGTANITDGHVTDVNITNPGSGYTTSNPPVVIFDTPLSYTNIPLVYSSSSIQGDGSSATVDIVVGQGSSVIDFTFKNTGYSYGVGEILTVNVGGNTGIPLDTTKTYSEFQLTVDEIYKDNFSGWVVGQFEHLDDISGLFDGARKTFPLAISDNPVSIRAAKGSLIDVKSLLLVFVNDVLQVPGESYSFEGGSVLTFTEAPDAEDSVKVLFYKGSGDDVDVVFRDVLETVKVGDTLKLNNDPKLGQSVGLRQDARVVTGINTTDSVQTNLYGGPGITTNDTLLRPVEWCRQTSDRIIDGKIVGKSRVKYEPLINPSCYAISSVGVGTTTIYVDNIKPFFDAQNESTVRSFQNKITLTSQDSIVPALATATVSSAGTISAITISDGGFGYTSAPLVVIQSPVGLGTTTRASATANISSGVVNSITITDGGSGYGTTDTPAVLIEAPKVITEDTNVDLYEGDSGIIVGYAVTNSILSLDLHIPYDSYLKDETVVGTAKTLSSLDVGDYFIVYNSNIENASTEVRAVDADSQVVGVGTQFVDSVYYVHSAEDVQVNVVGLGVTTVRRVGARVGVSTVDYSSSSITSDDSLLYEYSNVSFVSSIPDTAGFSTSLFFGNFSWGKINITGPTNSYNIYNLNGIGGISTSVVVNRTNPLKYANYTD